MLKATRQPKSTKTLAAPVIPVLTTNSLMVRLVPRLISLLLALTLQLLAGLAFLAPTVARAELASPQVAAPAAIAVDVASGRIIYGKNVHKQLPMASTTKIMTALTAFSIPGTSLSETYTIVKGDLVGEASIPLSEGEVISFRDLLWGTLMNSGNDGATAIARYAGSKLPGAGDPVAKFVARMNSYATQLGLQNSHYANPHGLDQDGHYSSVFDLAISGWYLLKNPTLKQIVGTQTATVANHALNNLNNPFLKTNPGANGIKPGYTDKAGLVLVGSATRDATTVIAVVMGEEAEGYRVDPSNLLNYSFAQLKDPNYLQKIQQGASAATAANYIGRPEGDFLRVFNGSDNSILNAQVSQAGTPGPTASSGSGAGGDDPNSKKGGVNIFTILLIILILLGLAYVVLRFTALGGDRGRQLAYALEDGAAKALYGLRKFWTYLKPGSNEDDADTPKRPKQTPALGSPPDLRSRLGQASGSRAAARNPQAPRESGGYGSPNLGGNQRVFGTGESQRMDLNNQDAISPFGRENPETESTTDYDNSDLDIPLSTDTESGPQPPRPLSAWPGAGTEPPVKPLADTDLPPFKASTPGRDAEPLVKPINPPTSNRPAPGGTVSTGPAASGGFGTSSPANPSGGNPRGGAGSGEGGGRSPGNKFGQPEIGDNLASHARLAVDYAYAGRLATSTEEFKRVVEKNPLFDFATIDGFERMPVVGYKALATAYRETGKPKFAVLLLEMAVEDFPSDLELRNMLKSTRRETEA